MEKSGNDLKISINLREMCQNNCSGNGNCSMFGECQCSEDFRGVDCSSSTLDIPELERFYFNTTWDLSKQALGDITFEAIKFIITENNSSLKYAMIVRKFKINL